MTGETQHVYAISAKTPGSKESDAALERLSKRDAGDGPASKVPGSPGGPFTGNKAPCRLSREPVHGQREAVIRPQQAGKIDFKSLQNRTKFSGDASWANGKHGPPSPTGKSRGKDKNKRSGKGDRSQHQLYRLSISSSSRSNPTIGIAYPQQKVTPLKKVEVSHSRPVSGSYRFHVPSLPEREAELHQEDLNFNRSLPDPGAGLTSANYTSQTASANRTHHGLKLQTGGLHDAAATANANAQLHYLEFQANGNSWHPSEKHFTETAGYPAPNPFPEGNKPDHGFGPVSFQYPFPPLQDPNGNSFCGNGNVPDFDDARGAFSFPSSSSEGPDDAQANGPYNTVLQDGRTYGLPSQQALFLHAPPSTPPCYAGRSDPSADHNGAISSSSGALTSSGAVEQSPSAFQEKQSVFNPSDFSLHNSGVPALVKRQQPAKNYVPGQRLLTPPGNTLRRNIPQAAPNKVHFSNKPYGNANAGLVPFDKNLARIPQTWDTGSSGFPPLDQTSLPYANASGNAASYQCDPRQALRNPRMPWQQAHLTSPTPNQLPRHGSNPKQPYNLGNSDWHGNDGLPKTLPGYHAKKHLAADGRPDANRQSYNSQPVDILYAGTKDANYTLRDSRTKGILYGMSQPIPQSRNKANQSGPLSGKTFVAESPCESPLPSPVTNPVNGSTCSSLSPMSSSPITPSSEESQLPPTLTSPPYYHQPFHQTDKSFPTNDPLNSSPFLYNSSDPTRNFHYVSDSSKDDQPFKNLPEKPYQKIPVEPAKECLEDFESEPPPPYSSHHFLASSLSSANLDQLDVLLTCKQCDQNFGNLSSFLDHRQYCHLNSVLQNEMKDPLHGGDPRKSAAEPLKPSQPMLALPLHKGPTEFNSQLPGVIKDYLLDGDDKGELKEDSIKGGTFHNAASHLLPLTGCDTLEMDEAKLDSLIIEALNGLEFQVENPEIDSAFIDDFVDDDFAAAKATGCGQASKVKESYADVRKNIRVDEMHAQNNQVPYDHEKNCDKDNTGNSYTHKSSIRPRNVTKTPEVGTAHPYLVDNEAMDVKLVKETGSEDSELLEKKKTMLGKDDSEELEDNAMKSYEFKQGKHYHDFSSMGATKPRKLTSKDAKKKKSHNGTWSKELIHKIVQQKNKLHKLHVKSNKDVQLSLVTERLYTVTKNHPFGEYDYISDSDEEVAANQLPSKTQPSGRLKYSFNREVSGRGGRAKLKEPVWRMGEATRFQLQSKDLRGANKDPSSRMRRRSSQSSNSSDQSTSISSEIGSSPKSTERTDSENEHETLRYKTFNARHPNTTLIKPLYRDNGCENQQLGTDFPKGTQGLATEKTPLASSKVYPRINAETLYKELETFKRSTELREKNANQVHSVEESKEKSNYQDKTQHKYASNDILDTSNVPKNVPTFQDDDTDYQKKQLNSLSSISSMVNTEADSTFCNNNSVNEDLCYGHKSFTLPMSCFSDLPPQSQNDFGNECQPFPEDKHVPSLYDNHLFAKTPIASTVDAEQIYTHQNDAKPMNSFEQKCPAPPLYASDKVPSAFSFDSSSMFAELPLSGFETPAYNDAAPPKENFIEYQQPNKANSFQPPFPQYLSEKSWDVIEENAPTMNSFPAADNQNTEKYREHVPLASEQVVGDVPRNVSDYNPSFISNISEDELEIKRLVTELENQLQTSKAPNDTAAQKSAKPNLVPDRTDSPLTFPEMEVNKLETSINNAYLNDNHMNLKGMSSLVLPSSDDCNVHDSQPLVKDNISENLKSPWTCSVQFDTFTSSFECHEQTGVLATAVSDPCVKGELGSLSDGHSSPSTISDTLLPSLANEMECQSFADHELLERSMSHHVSEKESQREGDENAKNNWQKMKEQFDDPPELEHFPSVSEFGFKHEIAPLLNTPDTGDRASLSNAVETFMAHGAMSKADLTNGPVLSDDKAELEEGNNARLSALLDMPVLEKEESVISEKSPKATTENPLQQLQLFVARTAKNNEEEMLMPCFPIILVASGPTESERDATLVLETLKADSENNLNLMENKGSMQLPESGVQVPQHDKGAYIAHKDISDALSESIKQTGEFENERPALNAINVSAHSMTDGDAKKVLQGQAKVNGEICHEENDCKKLSPSVAKAKKSNKSNHRFNKDKHLSNSMISPVGLSALNTTFDRPDVECLLPDALNIGVTQLSKEICHKGRDLSLPEETETLLVNNTSQDNTLVVSKDKCNAPKLLDMSSHIPLHPINSDVKDNYDAQLHGMDLPAEHSLLGFDLFSAVPNKESVPQQKPHYTPNDNVHLNDETPFPSEAMNPSDHAVTEKPVGAADIELFLSRDGSVASSEEASQSLMPSDGAITMTPVVEDGLSPCFCSELVCSHFKPRKVQSVAEIILGCPSMPTSNPYPPMYARENDSHFSSLHANIFPENSVAPLLCPQKEDTLKNDWNNAQDISGINHVYPNKDGSSDMVCDLMDIAPPEFVNFNCHQTAITERNDLSEVDVHIPNGDSEQKGTNDMHSVIDGVLRILEGDKSKEILQSIGITPKSSPVKEKKLAAQSLTCDVCLVTFRSKPGLMRHKAVKHNGSLTFPKETPSEKTLVAAHKTGLEWNCNSDGQQSLQSDATPQNIPPDFINQTASLQPSKEPSNATAEKSINGPTEDSVCTDIASKKKIKAKKRKVKPSNNKATDSQVPPDEVLNILKTNILKAIGQSNNFNAAEVKAGSERPTETNIQRRENLDDIDVKMCAPVSIDDDDEKLVSDVLDMEMNRENFIREQAWRSNLKEHVGHIANHFESHPAKSMLVNDQNLIGGAEQHLNAGKNVNVHNDVHVSNLPKETVTDLHSFFDDENTFSQLFPRDDHFIRRKCTRVYGKKARRQTPAFETDFRQLEMGDHGHPSHLNYACDYGNIPSESLPLGTDTDHHALYKHPSPSQEALEVETKMLAYVQQSHLESLTEPSLIKRHSLEEERDISSHINLSALPEESVDLSVGMASEIGECEMEEDLECGTGDLAGLPEFPTIDMKMLSAKFDMRELSFFSACGDDSENSDLDATDVAQKVEKRKRHTKNKTDDKRQLKNRSSVKMKNKDKQYKCKVCFQWFLTLGELDFHKLTHNPSPPPTCYMCVQRKFSSREQLRDHLKDKHAKNKAGLWICGMCLKEISDVWMYNEHLREHATQFARKGQAQKSVMGIPGCFGEDSMVRTFLSTFIYRTPTKPSKNVETIEKSPASKRQEPSEHKEEEEVVSEKEPENSVHVVPPAPKPSVNNVEGCQKSETIHKNASMHPHCKDPSRDCHHCGKQFPKPFKLQRHLVVHSLQKIYLCHRCPKSYQEAQELRSHLTGEHQLTEKSEIKHTTLYACELCADVMHVIKKSFICSTCNYTFSKKEQYDRHMEKHLIGGSMTFKFRGVARPLVSANEVKEKVRDSPEDGSAPPFKKRKRSSYSDLSADVFDCVDPTECPKLSPSALCDDEMAETPINAVKMEEMLLDFPLPQTERKEEAAVEACNPDGCPISHIVCELKVNDVLEDEPAEALLPILNHDSMLSSTFCLEKHMNFEVNNDKYSELTDASTKEQAPEIKMSDVEEQPPNIPVKPDDDISHSNLLEAENLFTLNDVLSSRDAKEPHCLLPEILEETKEDLRKTQTLEGIEPVAKIPAIDKSLVTDISAVAKDPKTTKKNRIGNQPNSKSAHGNGLDNASKSATPKSKPPCPHEKEGTTCTAKESTVGQQKFKKELTAVVMKANADFKMADKAPTLMTLKLHFKKSKEHKLSSHKGNAGSQENLDGEKKRKKPKQPATGKNEPSSAAKKSEPANGLLDSKDEVPASRAYPKPNAGGVAGHFKKTVLDAHNPKKVNATSNNGEYRCKRAPLAKSLHAYTPKTSGQNGPPHKRRLGVNRKPIEPSNYRTAESQNNLLSQLFGQKLTSFKIPLRRDTTD